MDNLLPLLRTKLSNNSPKFIYSIHLGKNTTKREVRVFRYYESRDHWDPYDNDSQKTLNVYPNKHNKHKHNNINIT